MQGIKEREERFLRVLDACIDKTTREGKLEPEVRPLVDLLSAEERNELDSLLEVDRLLRSTAAFDNAMGMYLTDWF